MTGGIGFSRQGSDSFKQNRALRNKRKAMKKTLIPLIKGAVTEEISI